MKKLKFKWTVSRGNDTYGYNICSLWVNDRKVSSCNGGGYDMKGTVLGYWMITEFTDKLKKLRANYGSGDNMGGFYGLSFYNEKRSKQQNTWSKDCSIYLDGACGFSSMETILFKIGYRLQFIDKEQNYTIYILENK